MNDNTTLLTHMRTDPNAPKHARIGMTVFFVSATYTFALYFAVADADIAPLIIVPMLMPLLTGIAIEGIQRIADGKNTNRESYLDTLTTWLWPIYYFQDRRKD